LSCLISGMHVQCWIHRSCSSCIYFLKTLMVSPGVLSFLENCGRLRSINPFGVGCPPIDYWPTQAIIWLMLIGESLDPHWDIINGLFCRCNTFIQTLPKTSWILFNSPIISTSKVWVALHPGCSMSLSLLYKSICMSDLL